MADAPSHYVLIVGGLSGDEEIRRLGPMHLGRAYKVKAHYENDPLTLRHGLDRVTIIDNPNWDFENQKEKEDADPNKTTR